MERYCAVAETTALRITGQPLLKIDKDLHTNVVRKERAWT